MRPVVGPHWDILAHRNYELWSRFWWIFRKRLSPLSTSLMRTFKTRLWSPVKRDVQNRFKSLGFSGSRLTMSCRLHFVEDEKCLSLGTSFHHRGKGPNCQPIYKLSRTWTITLHGVKSHNVWYIELLPLWCPGSLLSAAHSLYCSIFLLFHRKH